MTYNPHSPHDPIFGNVGGNYTGFPRDLLPQKPVSQIPHMSLSGNSGKPPENKPKDRKIAPVTSLKEINLESELVNLFNQTRDFLQDCLELEAGAAPINQIAQAINTCNAVLKEIVKSQGEIYNQERIKSLEGTLFTVLKTKPKEFQDEFLAEYKLAMAQMDGK